MDNLNIIEGGNADPENGSMEGIDWLWEKFYSAATFEEKNNIAQTIALASPGVDGAR